jgi:hypothetical protein
MPGSLLSRDETYVRSLALFERLHGEHSGKQLISRTHKIHNPPRENTHLTRIDLHS